jgi:hypothetical protein
MEGFDDGNEEGCGDKLLSLLQKRVLNISLLLFIYGIKACQVNILKIFTNMF